VDSLGTFLRERRLRIHPESRALGPCLRLAARVGKAVTQEELAEVVGVSRQWYGMLEKKADSRASTSVLGRLAGALMLDDGDRAHLFRLGVPELSRTSLSSNSLSLLTTFSSLRAFNRRLWNASTEIEALTITAEELCTTFTDARAIAPSIRVDQGRWDAFCVYGDNAAKRRHTEVCAALGSSFSPAESDELRLYPLLSQSGDIATMDTYRFTTIEPRLRAEFCRHDADEWVMSTGRVRTRHGFVAGIRIIHSRPRDFSEVELAILSTLTDCASLALT
jgi:transcriptional regulator with XRE-family HTH domain